MIDAVRGVLRVRRWPRKRGTPTSALQLWWIDWFRQANLLAKYADAASIVRSKEMAAGSGMYPRDILLKAMRGRLYNWTDQDGWKWYSMAAVGDISETLDVLAQTIGSLLVRAADRWRTVPPGDPGDVLTHQAADEPPVWSPPAGGGVPFGGAMVRSTILQKATLNVWKVLTWDTEYYDTDNIHDLVVNPTRLTVPAGWSKVRLTASIEWQSITTNNRGLTVYKNAIPFLGGAEVKLPSIGVSRNTLTTAAVSVVPGDYFEMAVWQDAFALLNIPGGTNYTHFSMQQAE